MRKYIFHSLLLGGMLFALTSVIHAQKIKKEGLEITYLQLPLKPLSKDFKNYTAIIDSKVEFPRKKTFSINKQGVGTQAEAEQDFLTLEGLERITADADVNIKLIIENLKVIESSINKSKDPYNQKTLYYTDIAYSLPATLKVIDKNNNVVIDEVISAPEQINAIRIGSDGSIGSSGMRYESLKALEEGIQDYFTTMALLKILSATSVETGDLAPKTVSRKYLFYSAEDKKQDYKDLSQAQQQALQALSMINSKSDPAQVKETFQKAITIWEKAIGEADVKNKKARINEKLYEMLHYNCALAYLLSDDFQQAKKYAEVAKDYKPPVPFVRTKEDDENYTEPILEQIRDREARYLANHF